MPRYRAGFTDQDRKYFGRLLTKLMRARGFGNAELARKASLHMPDQKIIGRDSISWYTSGKRIPGPVILTAIAKALDVLPEFMLTRAHDQAPGETPKPPREEESEGGISYVRHGRMAHIQLNRMLPSNIAWTIMNMVEEYDQKQREKKPST